MSRRPAFAVTLSVIALLAVAAAPRTASGAFQNLALRDAVVGELGPLQVQLAADYPGAFGGLWVDDSGTTTIAVVGDAPALRAAVARAGVSGAVIFRSTAYTERDIHNAHLAFRTAIDQASFTYRGLPLAAIREDVKANQVVVSVVGDAASVASLNASVADPIVRFESVQSPSTPTACTQTNCGNPMKAGLQLFNSSGAQSCMSNFTWRSKTTPYSYYLGAAGHCYTSVGIAVYHPAGLRIGYVTFTTAGSPNSLPDASLINITPANAGPQILNDRMQVYNITSREAIIDAVVGEGVCSSKKSGYTCGHLTSRSIDTCCSQDEFQADGQNMQGGDSGAPFHYGSKAQGIASANNCPGSFACFSPVQQVEIWKNFLVVLTN